MSTIIFFDLDDTLFDTSATLRYQLKTLFNQEYPANPFAPNYKTSPELYKLIGEASNMAISELYVPLQNINSWMRDMRGYYDVKFGICSHRGFTPLGEKYSTMRFRELGLTWDYLHFIKSEEHPNKIDFLNTTYPGENWILVDDRPLRDNSIPVPKNCLVMDQIWNQSLDVSPEQRVTPNSVLETLEHIVKINF
jgi:hypothetical protein